MVERMGAEFGLSPASRVRLDALPGSRGDPAIEALFS